MNGYEITVAPDKPTPDEVMATNLRRVDVMNADTRFGKALTDVVNLAMAKERRADKALTAAVSAMVQTASDLRRAVNRMEG